MFAWPYPAVVISFVRFCEESISGEEKKEWKEK